jgi:YfiH family protein
LSVPEWEGHDWLVHGFSSRKGGVSNLAGDGASGGDLNLGFTSRDTAEAVLQNRERLLASVANSRGIGWGLVTLKQMHSGLVRRVGREDVAERASLWGDGLLTDEPGVLLGIQTADCLPILIADPKRKAVGAFHAGWRGTLKGIVGNGVKSMGIEFGSVAEDLIAAIGPGIGTCCFGVGDELRAMFAERYSYADELFSHDGKLRLDLVEANRRQLLSTGLAPEAIFALQECTSCQTNRFFSYRAEKGKTGRMMAVIGVAD